MLEIHKYDNKYIVNFIKEHGYAQALKSIKVENIQDEYLRDFWSLARLTTQRIGDILSVEHAEAGGTCDPTLGY